MCSIMARKTTASVSRLDVVAAAPRATPSAAAKERYPVSLGRVAVFVFFPFQLLGTRNVL